MDFVAAWSPQVRDDLNAIAAYIAKGSPRYASAVIQEILAAGRSLTHFPLRGCVVPETRPRLHGRDQARPEAFGCENRGAVLGLRP